MSLFYSVPVSWVLNILFSCNRCLVKLYRCNTFVITIGLQYITVFFNALILILYPNLIKGAPGFITENIKPERGLVNGTQVTYHSLVLDEREDRERIAEELMYLANGEDIPLQFPPQYINVIVNAADPADFLDMT